jgi:hypothetical protein
MRELGRIRVASSSAVAKAASSMTWPAFLS